jgi:DHA2 family multidrug resistance protein-like MFS transporter
MHATTPPPTSTRKATRRDWVGLTVLALPCVLYSMDLNVLHLAVPSLTADLRPSATQLLWIVDIYGFLLAGCLLTMGTLGDRIGRRRLLMIGAGAFGLTSILAAFASTPAMLIAARALLGIAAATLAPSTLSLIRNMFVNDKERSFAIGVWVGSFAAGGALGPLIGGALLQHFWWGSVFLIAVPVMALLLILGPWLLPEFKDPNPGKLDLSSAALATGSVLAVIYGVKHIAVAGIGVHAGVFIVLGIVLGVLFVRRQQRLADPFIDVRLLQSRIIASALSINILSLFIAFGCFLFLAQYLQLVLGMAPLEAGLWTAPTGVVFILGSICAPALFQRYGARIVMTAGLLLAAVGFVFLTQVGYREQLWILITGLLLLCAGLSPVGTISTDLVVSAAPPERAGAASGISETSFEFGGALGIAVLGSIVAALYQSYLAALAFPNVPSEALAAARDTLGGALAAAESLQGAGDALLAAARDAYVRAFRLTSGLCLALALGAALYAWIVLPARVASAAPASQAKAQSAAAETDPAA